MSTPFSSPYISLYFMTTKVILKRVPINQERVDTDLISECPEKKR
jgi:hypothetical protein